ncbi:hypothetical protein B0J12DRAFT_250250 [Macrophomina phaseolina]|uniref:Uncharacterized protein n=1 Tax=Macrophomina phaseolina TaxID=35725 RepID=A0ABQ8G022_9PEZI|nr:hypothetical protein B0J12DRAFT_250250 [Macrophomina phaseolina]
MAAAAAGAPPPPPPPPSSWSSPSDEPSSSIPEPTKICSNCGQHKLLSLFVTTSVKGRTRTLVQCADCRNSKAGSRKRRAASPPPPPNVPPVQSYASSRLPTLASRPSRIRQPTFFRRGINSQDSPQTATARRELTAVTRRHRVERRGGYEPSLTPSLTQLAARNHVAAAQASSGLSTAPPTSALDRAAMSQRSSSGLSSLPRTS